MKQPKRRVGGLTKIAWEGDSLEVLKEFPKAVKRNFGLQLRLLQQGEMPKNFKSMKSIGSGVYELREQDKSHWYRVIYLAKVNDTIYVLHSFRKKTAKTERPDINTATKRLKALKKALG